MQRSLNDIRGKKPKYTGWVLTSGSRQQQQHRSVLARFRFLGMASPNWEASFWTGCLLTHRDTVTPVIEAKPQDRQATRTGRPVPVHRSECRTQCQALEQAPARVVGLLLCRLLSPNLL